MQITFVVNLLDDNDSTLLTPAEREIIARTKSTWIPGRSAGDNLIKKHGDIFTLYGGDAIYLQHIINQSQVLGVSVAAGSFSMGFSEAFDVLES